MNPFALLGVESRFDLDLSALEKTHRELSRALHPDRFAQSNASERRAALEKAAAVNEAWRTLRNPIKRAEALFRMHGIAVGEDNEPKASNAFLMDVLEMREELAEARAKKDIAKVTKLGEGMKKRLEGAQTKLADGFAAKAEPLSLLPFLGEMRFYERFLEEVDAIEEEANES